jgi:pimeloyl-ACP methyl ester carboxylesterase
MRAVDVGDLRITYERAGTGPSVVLVHGYVGDGPSVWRPQLDALADAFDLIAWDAPGAGGSSDPPASFGMAGYADCLAGLIGVLGLDRPHIVGLSFGGAMAIELCRRHPSVARTLVLASAYAGWAGSLPPDETDRRLQQALALSELSPSDLVDALMPTMFAATTPTAAVAPFRAALEAFHPTGLRAMATASADDLRPALASIDVPTLLIYGAEDTRAPRPVAEQLHAAIPRSELVVLEGAGHVCNIDAADAFNAALRGFIAHHAEGWTPSS